MLAVEKVPVSTDPITPLSASRNTWQPVHLWAGLVGVSGGHAKKPSNAPSIMVEVDGEQRRFVELSKNAEWFLKAVGGTRAQKGELCDSGNS